MYGWLCKLGLNRALALLAVLLGLAVMIPLLMAYWFAPALVLFHGIGAVDADKADAFLQSLDLPALTNGCRGLIDDMDRIADRIFERRTS